MSAPNNPVVYQCTVDHAHRLLFCEPIGGGVVTVYCYQCPPETPMAVVPFTGELVWRLHIQSLAQGRAHAFMMCREAVQTVRDRVEKGRALALLIPNASILTYGALSALKGVDSLITEAINDTA